MCRCVLGCVTYRFAAQLRRNVFRSSGIRAEILYRSILHLMFPPFRFFFIFPSFTISLSPSLRVAKPSERTFRSMIQSSRSFHVSQQHSFPPSLLHKTFQSRFRFRGNKFETEEKLSLHGGSVCLVLLSPKHEQVQ